MQLKLTMELIPRTAFYQNLRNIVGRDGWDKIRKEVYSKFNHRCGICMASGRLNCHEIWGYDDTTHIQKLMGFIALCDMCHGIKHLGHSILLASKGSLHRSTLINHFLVVNNCSMDDFDKHRIEEFARWKERSQHDWVLDLGEFSIISALLQESKG